MALPPSFTVTCSTVTFCWPPLRCLRRASICVVKVRVSLLKGPLGAVLLRQCFSVSQVSPHCHRQFVRDGYLCCEHHFGLVARTDAGDRGDEAVDLSFDGTLVAGAEPNELSHQSRESIAVHRATRFHHQANADLVVNVVHHDAVIAIGQARAWPCLVLPLLEVVECLCFAGSRLVSRRGPGLGLALVRFSGVASG